jgi:glycosyltransferase involved in cell wall biosynthesis
MEIENSSNLSIIIPVYNEEKIIEENCKKLVRYLNKRFREYEIILGDNGSTDPTPEKCRKISKRFKKIKFIRIPKKGIGLALQEMIKRARFENIIFLPIDMSVDLNFIDKAFFLLKEYDIVVGSKRIKGAIDDRPFNRRLLTFLFNLSLNILFNLGIKDTQCVKAFRKSSILEINESIKSEDIFFDVELLMKSKKLGLKIIEVPVVCRDYRKSKFMIWRELLELFLKLIKFSIQNIFIYE